jgi:hypothetical protein
MFTDRPKVITRSGSPVDIPAKLKLALKQNGGAPVHCLLNVENVGRGIVRSHDDGRTFARFDDDARRAERERNQRYDDPADSEASTEWHVTPSPSRSALRGAQTTNFYG